MMRKFFIATVTFVTLFSLNSVAQVPVQQAPPPPPPPAPIQILYNIPASFTPNGDGNNDLFFVSGSIAALELKIFNRWGQEVAVLDQPSSFWDGKYKKTALESAVFYYTGYVLTTDNIKHDIQGNVSLIR